MPGPASPQRRWLSVVSPDASHWGDILDDDALIAFWIAYQVAAGSTKKSIRERRYVLTAMLQRTGASILTVTRNDLIRDLARDGIVASTRSHYKSFMYGFFTWLQDEGFRQGLPHLPDPASKQ